MTLELTEPRTESPVVTGFGVLTALGRGTAPLLDAALAGRPAFTRIERFDPSRHRVQLAATLAGTRDLATELTEVIGQACTESGLAAELRAGTPLLLAARVDPALARMSGPERVDWGTGALAAALARRCGLAGAVRAYAAGCVAGSTAVTDAAGMIAAGRLDRAVIAAGFLVDPDNQAIFDAGRALSDDGRVRPFSTGRRGLLLGDGVAAIVLESASSARRRRASVLARLVGWGRAGDAYHVCQPHPGGAGLARAAGAALRRGGVDPRQVGYVNANGTGTAHADAAESAALHQALGEAVTETPVSSTKAVHGHTLEASGLVELIVTMLALRAGQLPVNAGYLAPDEECRLDLVLDEPRRTGREYALSVNFAFGGANTALLVGAP